MMSCGTNLGHVIDLQARQRIDQTPRSHVNRYDGVGTRKNVMFLKWSTLQLGELNSPVPLRPPARNKPSFRFPLKLNLRFFMSFAKIPLGFAVTTTNTSAVASNLA